MIGLLTVVSHFQVIVQVAHFITVEILVSFVDLSGQAVVFLLAVISNFTNKLCCNFHSMSVLDWLKNTWSNSCPLYPISGVDRCQTNISSAFQRKQIQTFSETFNTSMCIFQARFPHVIKVFFLFLHIHIASFFIMDAYLASNGFKRHRRKLQLFQRSFVIPYIFYSKNYTKYKPNYLRSYC